MAAGADEAGHVWAVPLVSSQDVARARQAANEAMAKNGASVIKRTRFVTAVSEIARNAIVHGGGGNIRFTLGQAEGERMLVAECTDRGPGIDDMEQALRDGFTSGGGLGHGLGGARRLVDRFDIRSSTRYGTTVRLETRLR